MVCGCCDMCLHCERMLEVGTELGLISHEIIWNRKDKSFEQVFAENKF